MFVFACYLSGQVWTDANSTPLGCHLESEAYHSFDLQKSFLAQTSMLNDREIT